MKRIFLCLVLVMVFLPTVAFAHTMPDSEFRFDDITFGKPMSTMTSLFGHNMKRTEISVGGMFTSITYKFLSIEATARCFPDQEIPEAELPIQSVRLTSSQAATRSGYLATPSGFRVGIPYSKVVECFGEVEPFKIPGCSDIVYVYAMPSNQGRQMAFSVNEQGIITKISLETEI